MHERNFRGHYGEGAVLCVFILQESCCGSDTNTQLLSGLKIENVIVAIL